MFDGLIESIKRRPPDEVIGGPCESYLLRWYVIPHNRIFNVYLHCFLRSDDDRALHDHPWSSMNVVLRGGYVEHTIVAGGIRRQRSFRQGDWILRLRGGAAHRLQISGEPCWVSWRKFAVLDDSDMTEKGCDT